MKKAVCLLMALLFSLPVCGCGEPEPTETLNIWVATDNHYLSPTLTDGGETFMSVVSSADGKITHYSAEVADALFYEVKQEKPDVFIIAGDLTLNGAKVSHTELAEKLREVEKAGVDVLVIPGNHDVNSTGYSFSDSGATQVEGVTAEEFREIYGDFGLSDAISRDEYTFSYVYEAAEDLRIVMLDTNSLGKCYLQDDTKVWLENELKAAKEAGSQILSVTHQNLFAHSELLSFGYQLYDADELLEMYKTYGVKLNLSGHIHVQSIKEQEGVTEVATSATTVAPLQYGRLTFDGKSFSYAVQKINVAKWSESVGATDQNLKDLNAYATEFFKENGKNTAYDTLADSGLGEDDLRLMAETFAEINTAYFAGVGSDRDEFKKGIALWEEKGGFVASYIESMLSAPENCTSVTVELDGDEK